MENRNTVHLQLDGEFLDFLSFMDNGSHAGVSGGRSRKIRFSGFFVGGWCENKM